MYLYLTASFILIKLGGGVEGKERGVGGKERFL
jgi:hypothetical protein